MASLYGTNHRVVPFSGDNESINSQFMGGDPEKDEKVTEQGENILQKSQDFLSNFPPDWDAAEKHGRAMIACKTLTTMADFSDPDSFDLASLQPVPTDEQRFSTCFDTNEAFGEMGSIGIPLFFEFNKCLSSMFCCTAIFYFLPMVALIGTVYSQVYDKLPKDSSSIGLVSIGIFLYDPIMPESVLINKTAQTSFGIRYLAFSQRKDFIGYAGLLLILAVLVFVISLTCARIHLTRMAFKLDDAICTQSDFGL
jgi:hypothetical protein